MTEEEKQNKNAEIEKLIYSISFGNTQSMGRLYDLIKTDVFAYALSKMANKGDAEDIMQDTFVQIYKHAKQYLPKGKPMAWIFTIELNLIRRFFQINSRTTELPDLFENTYAKENVEEKIIDNLFLIELVKNLSQDEREIISLHVVSNMKHKEIAKLLGKPLSTVLSRYNRAIKKLQLIVKESKNESIKK
ncbi:MAG: RNA polymerase sigma factor [Clostridia bacterium]|nr:RNA polymerase sigma factor [Clostridia bacterium]